jgi:hypothetical protein
MYYFDRNFWEYLRVRFRVENIRIPLLPYKKHASAHNEHYRTQISAKQAVKELKKLNQYELRILRNCKKALQLFENKIMKEIVKKKSMPEDVKKTIVHAIRLIHSFRMRIKDHQVRLHMMNDYIDAGDIRSFLRMSDFYFDDYSFYFPIDTFAQRVAYDTHGNHFSVMRKLERVKKTDFPRFPYVRDIIHCLMQFTKIKELFFGVRREIILRDNSTMPVQALLHYLQ